jgi:hypothetical protein
VLTTVKLDRFTVGNVYRHLNRSNHIGGNFFGHLTRNRSNLFGINRCPDQTGQDGPELSKGIV